MAYDRQVIVQLGFDEIIKRNARRLQQRAMEIKKIPSTLVEVGAMDTDGAAAIRPSSMKALRSAFARLTGESRVYLQGHGDWKSQHLEAFSAEQVATILNSAGMPSVKLVSVLGCSLGRDRSTESFGPRAAPYERLGGSVDSFAAGLHFALRERGIVTTVHARLFNVVVLESGRKAISIDDDSEKENYSHEPDTKVAYYWLGDRQCRGLAIYAPPGVVAS